MNDSNEFFVKIYTTMLRIRICEESLVDPILKGEIQTPCHLYSGEEAIAVGVCTALQKEDLIFGNHRSHGHFLAKGGDLKDLMAEIYGRETGCSRGRGGSMHLIDSDNGMLGSAPIVAGTISLALGAALAASIRKMQQITVSFFGDGAAGEGVLYEALNFAALKKLPIIFACENNFYSTHLPIRECRVQNQIHKIAEPFCIETHEVDGNEVLQAYEVTRKVADKCRNGEGPAFLEFLTYRFRGHVGPDDNIQGTHTDIRPPEEMARWLKKDPIKKFGSYLLENGILDQQALDKIRSEAEKEVAAAHLYAQNSLLPDQRELLKYVYR